MVQVLNPRRNLDKFSPQQLAAIAWSYAMVNFDAPQLFAAVRDEASRKPQLAEMLNKAGLLHNPGSQMSLAFAGAGQRGPAGAGAVGGSAFSPRTFSPPLRPQAASANHGMGALGQQPNAGGQMQGMGGGMGGLGNNGAHGMGYQGSQTGQHGQQGLSGQAHSSNNKGGGFSQQGHAQQAAGGYAQADTGNGQSAHGAGKGSEVARAAEEHKKEMEEKQRQVIGCEEGDACPLCVEEMDATDLALVPCPCGYQVCLLCLNKIRKEGNKQCPACRTEYVLSLSHSFSVSVSLLPSSLYLSVYAALMLALAHASRACSTPSASCLGSTEHLMR
jgi:hypothetical protein